MSSVPKRDSYSQPMVRYIGGPRAGCAGVILRNESAVRVGGRVFHTGCAHYRDELRRTRDAITERRSA